MTQLGTPAVAFYGDDFTGSSENLAQYHRHGLKSVLFFDAAAAEAHAEMAAGHDVVGIAGIARSLAPDAMLEELRPAFEVLRRLGSRIVQYKVCSTFDSAPQVGNFGTVLTLARAVWPDCFLPIHSAMPELGRYTAFGNHFARFGEEVFRLDRHPSMSRHPSTPMDEADLIRHLARQTDLPIENLDCRQLDGDLAAARERLAKLRAAGSAVLFDGLTAEHLRRSGALIEEASREQQVFALAAQGLAHGLGEHLAALRGLPSPSVPALPAVERMLVLSGSCAPMTQQQIACAEAAGWASVRLDVAALLDEATRAQSEAAVLQTARRLMCGGRDVILYTAKGPNDGQAEVRAAAARLSLPASAVARQIGASFAAIARSLVWAFGLRRIVLSGGDTSSYAMRAIGAYAITIDRVDTRQSAHVCRLHSDQADIRGLQVLLKGGQIGEEDIFLHAKAGTRL